MQPIRTAAINYRNENDEMVANDRNGSNITYIRRTTIKLVMWLEHFLANHLLKYENYKYNYQITFRIKLNMLCSRT